MRNTENRSSRGATPSTPRRVSLTVLRRTNRCPAGPGDERAEELEGADRFSPASIQSVSDQLEESGRYCYAVFLRGRLGRPSQAATVFYGYSPRGGTPGPGPYPPAASWLWSEDQRDPTLIRFYDESEDIDGSVTSWSWDFGDGSSSSERNPAHDYPAPGTYTVTLTVTDNQGLTDSSTRTIDPGGGSGGGGG